MKEEHEDLIQNQVLALECQLLEMWDKGSPHSQVIRKQEKDIISLTRRIKELGDSSQKKDEIILKYEEKLNLLNSQDQAMWDLHNQQTDLVKSLLAKVSLERKTKFIQGSRKLQYHRTCASMSVKQEIARASARLWEEKRLQQQEEIKRLVAIVDVTALNYPPAHKSCVFQSGALPD